MGNHNFIELPRLKLKLGSILKLHDSLCRRGSAFVAQREVAFKALGKRPVLELRLKEIFGVLTGELSAAKAVVH